MLSPLVRWLLFVLLAPATAVLPIEQGGYRPLVPLGLDELLPFPSDNVLTTAKVELGRMLFFDKRLSGDGSVACASCHVPQKAFTNGERVATGVRRRRGTRNVPTLLNRSYGSFQFWDGRAASLEEQTLAPFQNPKEMDMNLTELEKRLSTIPEYRKAFEQSFGRNPESPAIAKALAAFVRTLLTGDSPFDRFDHGELSALSEEARHGLDLFRTKAGCVACHTGSNFTDERFHNSGVAWRNGRLLDPGRFAVTGQEQDRGAFKTPTLREIARTAPYMHDGSLATLEEVIEFYNRGGNSNPYLDPKLRPLRLTSTEKQALLTFLRNLSGKTRTAPLPDGRGSDALSRGRSSRHQRDHQSRDRQGADTPLSLYLGGK